MASGPRYSVKFRRRRSGKTNYHKRLRLLKARKPRLVIRKSNKYIICQLIEYATKGDKTLLTIHSSQLKRFGWEYSYNNLSAAYLTGLLAGKQVQKLKIKEVISDLGLYSSTKGSKLYATLKGALDSGLNIPISEDNIPTENRIKGEHISKDITKAFELVKKKIEGAK